MSPLSSSPLFRTHTCSQQRGSPTSPLPSAHTHSASSPPFRLSVSRYCCEASTVLEILVEDGAAEGRRRSAIGRSESRQTVNSSDAMTTWQPESRQAARRAFQEYVCNTFKNKHTHTHRLHALTHTKLAFQEKSTPLLSI